MNRHPFFSKCYALKRFIAPSLTATLLASIGCQGPLPKGYVQVEPGSDRTFRAVSAEGSAFTLRIESNPKNADLAFWEKAVDSPLVGIRGYQPDGRREVTHKSGTPGVELLYHYDRDGIDYAYVLTLLVRGDDVYVFEAAGTQDRMSADLPAIQSSIQAWPL